MRALWVKVASHSATCRSNIVAVLGNNYVKRMFVLSTTFSLPVGRDVAGVDGALGQC